MTITLDIKPKLQAELAPAAAHGSAVEAYAATLVEEAIHLFVSLERRIACRSKR
jgi:hypothetical protein